MRPEEILLVVGALVDDWCERRCLSALGRILRAYPLMEERPGAWDELLLALRAIEAEAAAELTAEELESLERLAGAIEVWMARRV
jgi:hypothetical protein